MASSANHIILCNTTTITTKPMPMQLQRCRITHTSTTTAGDDKPTKSSRRWAIMLTVLAASSTTPLLRTPPSRAQSWGTHSFMKEKYFMPDISPEDSVARIRQTTEGMHEMRHMLDTMSWRYVMFYIRLKAAYLETDLKNAMTVVPKPKHQSYIKIANEVVDSMTDVSSATNSFFCDTIKKK